MPGQPIRKLNEDQTSNMLKKVATDAATRKTRILEAVRDTLHSYVQYIWSFFILLYYIFVVRQNRSQQESCHDKRISSIRQ